jgi:NADPH:quinone reductase-like Zn-dependent oxidoreductase
VIVVGSATTHWKVGDHVAPTFFVIGWLTGSYQEQLPMPGLGAGAVDGVMADVTAVPGNTLVRLPAGLSSAEGSALPCAAVTAWHALVLRGKLAAGDTLLVQGTGSVSLFDLQIDHFLESLSEKPIPSSVKTVTNLATHLKPSYNAKKVPHERGRD